MTRDISGLVIALICCAIGTCLLGISTMYKTENSFSTTLCYMGAFVCLIGACVFSIRSQDKITEQLESEGIQ